MQHHDLATISSRNDAGPPSGSRGFVSVSARTFVLKKQRVRAFADRYFGTIALRNSATAPKTTTLTT
jgi:hypothetical protein